MNDAEVRHNGKIKDIPNDLVFKGWKGIIMELTKSQNEKVNTIMKSN
jgi:hypothetical protein